MCIVMILMIVNGTVSVNVSIVDPDPHGAAFILVGWIRIRIWNTDSDPDPGVPKWPTKVKKIQGLEILDVHS